MASTNYRDVLTQLQNAGLLINELEIGHKVRCRVEGEREKRGWYWLHEIITKHGDSMIVGSFGIWRGDNSNTQKVEIRKDAFSSEQLAQVRKRIKEDTRRAEAARAAQAKRAADEARKAWAKCTPDGDSDYLARKGVGAHGVRFSPSGALVIPLLDTTGSIHGLQVIRSAKQVKEGRALEKEFWPSGVAKRGHFHLIGMPSAILLVAEGYATGATLHEATGLPVAIAWDAGNLAPVGEALRKRYPKVKMLFCADDDVFAKCGACKARLSLLEHSRTCPACGNEHRRSNTGVAAASSASVSVGNASFAVPIFLDFNKRLAEYLGSGRKITDYNDLHLAEGLHVVRSQIEHRLTELKWSRVLAAAPTTADRGQGAALRPIESLDELLERFALIYNLGGSVFDRQEHCVVSISDMRDACRHRDLHRDWMQHPDRNIVRAAEVDFDPSCADPAITCNLWAGWPTQPKAGKCEQLLVLLRHMCGEDAKPERLYNWVLRWLAYPIQHPGAKMKSTLVLHGPQGTGKNLFFEAVMDMYGPYGRVIDQSAIEDKFNDWASRKLFLIADEVVARTDLFHVKNKLKAFITGTWIRINPKNLAARDERNHVNLVFLSNEAMPVALEEDDRRHAVIWTPKKLMPEFYAGVLDELRNGGAAALQDYLAHLELGDFGEGTLPPYTDAKEELIDLGRDSTTRFFYALQVGEIGAIKCAPALSEDVYELYKFWCHRVGQRAAPLVKLINALKRRHSVQVERKRYTLGQSTYGPHNVVLFGGYEAPPGADERAWLGDHIEAFRNAFNDYRGERRL